MPGFYVTRVRGMRHYGFLLRASPPFCLIEVPGIPPGLYGAPIRHVDNLFWIPESLVLYLLTDYARVRDGLYVLGFNKLLATEVVAYMQSFPDLPPHRFVRYRNKTPSVPSQETCLALQSILDNDNLASLLPRRMATRKRPAPQLRYSFLYHTHFILDRFHMSLWAFEALRRSGLPEDVIYMVLSETELI